jgi:hypothetical protein
MSITSADWSTGAVANTKGSYSITIPWNIGLITFDYEYTTIDRDNSSFDMATYTLGGEETDLVASDIPKFGSESGTKTLNTTGLGGTTLSINQKCTDCVLGTATVRITGFRGTPFRESNQLLVKSPATLSMGASSYTCKPGAFTFLNRGVTSEAGAPTSLIYSLIRWVSTWSEPQPARSREQHPLNQPLGPLLGLVQRQLSAKSWPTRTTRPHQQPRTAYSHTEKPILWSWPDLKRSGRLARHAQTLNVGFTLADPVD